MCRPLVFSSALFFIMTSGTVLARYNKRKERYIKLSPPHFGRYANTSDTAAMMIPNKSNVPHGSTPLLSVPVIKKRATCHIPNSRRTHFWPSIDISYHAPPKIAYWGEMLQITCLGVVGKNGYVVLQARKSGRRYPIRKTDVSPDIGYQKQEIQYIWKECDKSYKKYIVTVMFRITIQTVGTKFRCDLRNGFHGDSTTFELGFVVRVGPKTPTIEVKASNGTIPTVGTKFSAKCSGFIGERGRFAAALVTFNNKMIDRKIIYLYNADTGGLMFGTELPGISVFAEFDESNTTFGPKWNFFMNGTVTEELDGAQILCFTHAVGNSIADLYDINDKLRVASERFSLQMRPTAVMHYDFGPKSPLVDAGTEIDANCTAIMKESGSMAWIFHHKRTVVWVISKRSHITGSSDGGGFNVEVTEAGYKDSRPTLVSRISAIFHSGIAGGSLQCDSDYIGVVWTTDLRNGSLSERSDVIVLGIGIGEPSLKVNYHGGIGVVSPDKVLDATCNAFVGLNGSLTWVLTTGNMSLVWTVDTDAKVKPQGVNGIVIHAFVVNDDKRGPLIDSTILIPVTDDLEDAKLVCYSYDISTDYSGSGGSIVLNASSVALRVVSKTPFRPHMVMLVLIALGVIACIVCVNVMLGETTNHWQALHEKALLAAKKQTSSSVENDAGDPEQKEPTKPNRNDGEEDDEHTPFNSVEGSDDSPSTSYDSSVDSVSPEPSAEHLQVS